MRGFYDLAGKCVPVVLPDHAELDLPGHDWTCTLGFKRIVDHCAPMSAAEKQRLADIGARLQERQRRLNAASCTISGKPATGIHAVVVLQRAGCDYFIADGPSGLFLLEWYGGHEASEGDVIIGPLDSYGFKDVCYSGYDEGRIWVDDYLLSESTALERYRAKCN